MPSFLRSLAGKGDLVAQLIGLHAGEVITMVPACPFPDVRRQVRGRQQQRARR